MNSQPIKVGDKVVRKRCRREGEVWVEYADGTFEIRWYVGHQWSRVKPEELEVVQEPKP